MAWAKRTMASGASNSIAFLFRNQNLAPGYIKKDFEEDSVVLMDIPAMPGVYRRSQFGRYIALGVQEVTNHGHTLQLQADSDLDYQNFGDNLRPGGREGINGDLPVDEYP